MYIKLGKLLTRPLTYPFISVKMVALKPSEAKNHSGAENMLGIKKSKKKKSKKINTEESDQGRGSYLIES